MKQSGTKARMAASYAGSVLITVLYFSVVYHMLPFLYEINDDVAMRNVAAGVITGSPDAHLIFVKYILGLGISGLYYILPGWDWYGIIMVGTILFSMSVVLYRGLIEEKGKTWKAIYSIFTLLLFTCIGLQHIVMFQWTLSAAFAGAAGIFLFYTAKKGDGFQKKFEEGVSVFLLFICLLIRESVFYMMFPVAALCFWWKYGTLRENHTWKFRLRHWGIPVVLCVGVISILATEKWAYHTEEWQDYLAYNEERSVIMDYYSLKNYDEEPEFYQQMDLSKEEVENLQRYSLYLCDDLYREKMHALAEHVQEEHVREYTTIQRLKDGTKMALEHLFSAQYLPVNLFAYLGAAIFLILSWLKNKRECAWLCLLNLLIGCMWIYLGFKGRIVDRVGYAMFLLQLTGALSIGWKIMETDDGRQIEKPWTKNIILGCTLTLLAVFSVIKWKEVEEKTAWRSSYNKEFLDVNRYMAEHPDNVYFMTTFSIETYTDNFTLRRDFCFSNLLSVGGWHTFSPLENKKCAKLGIGDPKRDIVEKENVYVISLENVNLRYMDRYYKSVYGDTPVKRELIEPLSYGGTIFEVYKFRIGETDG